MSNKELIILFGLVGLSVVIGALVIFAYDANEKFDNVNTNFQEMKLMFFNNQIGNMQYNCNQDFELDQLNDDIPITVAMNDRTECNMKINVSKKIFDYQNYQIEPTFSDKEVTYLELILTQSNVPIFEKMLQFTSAPPTEEEMVLIENVTVNGIPLK